jgi:hypothetical protein
MVFNATFDNITATLYIVAISFIGGGNRRTQRTRNLRKIMVLYEIYREILVLYV